MIARRLAESHLAGPEVGDALRLAGICARRGWSFALGPWVPPENTARQNFTAYTRAIEALAGFGGERPEGYLSLKLSTIGYDGGMFAELLERGRGSGIRVHCDSIGPESAEQTMALLGKLAASHPNIGSTLPAGWRRSIADAPVLAEWGVAIRIVKGQWPDPAGRTPDLRAAYLALVRALAGRPNRIGIATHDRRVARESLSILTAAGTPCDMEQISSLPQNCASLARSLGVPFRLYIPYGHPYIPYNIWQVRTRPEIAIWMIRDFIAGKHRAIG